MHETMMDAEREGSDEAHDLKLLHDEMHRRVY